MPGDPRSAEMVSVCGRMPSEGTRGWLEPGVERPGRLAVKLGVCGPGSGCVCGALSPLARTVGAGRAAGNRDVLPCPRAGAVIPPPSLSGRLCIRSPASPQVVC